MNGAGTSPNLRSRRAGSADRRGVLVVLASAHDATARRIVAEWAPWNAQLCVPADLSVSGWRHRVGAPGDATAVIGGRAIPASAITGVLTRLPAVRPEELGHIATADRDYVASEMTAFLIAFVSALPCRVLNRPTAGSLAGPAWRPEQWLRVACLAGIPVRTARRSPWPDAPAQAEAQAAVRLIVAGDRVIGAAEPQLAKWARSLAGIAGVALLEVGFAQRAGGYELVTVNALPDLDTQEGLDGAREFLLAGGGTPGR